MPPEGSRSETVNVVRFGVPLSLICLRSVNGGGSFFSDPASTASPIFEALRKHRQNPSQHCQPDVPSPSENTTRIPASTASPTLEAFREHFRIPTRKSVPKQAASPRKNVPKQAKGLFPSRLPLPERVFPSREEC